MRNQAARSLQLTKSLSTRLRYWASLSRLKSVPYESNPQMEVALMTEEKVLENQKLILANQERILGNQVQILENQTKLDAVLQNQARIEKRQEQILANQERILTVVAGNVSKPATA